jgi:hypothetical protein
MDIVIVFGFGVGVFHYVFFPIHPLKKKKIYIKNKLGKNLMNILNNI